MNKIFCFILIFYSLFGFTQKDTVAHIYTFGSFANDIGEDIVATSDGGFAIIGSTASSGNGNSDIYLLKVDSICNYQWSWALGGANNDWGYSIKQTHDNGFIIAATTNSYGNGGYDAMLLKRDSFGNYQWQKTYGGMDWDFAYDVVQTFDSGYVFCGETYNNSNGFSDVYVVKTNSIGDIIWTRTIGGSLMDKGNALIETSDSNIVVVGIKNTITDSAQAFVLKFDKDGSLLWENTYGGLAYENLNDVIELQSGNYAAVGSSNSLNANFDLDQYYLNIDVNGNVVSTVTNVTTGISSNDDEVFSVIQLQNGNLLLSGYTKSYGYAKKDVQLSVLTENGSWGGVGVTLGYLENDEVFSSAITYEGRIVLAGKSNSYGFGNNDVFLIRLDSLYQTGYTNQHDVTQYEDIAPIGINEKAFMANDIRIYPNPTDGIVQIAATNWPIEMRVIDNLGKNVFSTIITGQSSTHDFSILIPGFYSIQFYNQTNKFETKKLIIAY